MESVCDSARGLRQGRRAEAGWRGWPFRVGSAPLLAVVLACSACSLQDLDGLSSDTQSLGGESGSSGAGGSESGSGGMPPDSGTGGSGEPDAEPFLGNLLLNPGFEQRANIWRPVGACSLAIVGDDPHEGESCLRVAGRTETWQGPGYDVLTITEPGRGYRIEVWVRSDGDPHAVNLTHKTRCPDQDDNTAGYDRLVDSAPVSGDWTKLTALMVVPDDCQLLESLIYIEGPPVGVDFYLDDASLMLDGG